MKQYLSDEEVLALTHTLVRDNRCMTHIRHSSGTYGAGNTNTSPYSGSSIERPLNYYEGEALTRTENTCGTQVAAAVEDVLYLVECHFGRTQVIRLRMFESRSQSEGIAYDTYELTSIAPVSDRVVTLKTDIGTYEGTVVDGLPEGKGVYKYNQNDPEGRLRCEGFFLEGEPVRRCTITYRDGSSYMGWLEDGLFDDRGEFHFPNGDYYQGYFKAGKMHGSGILFNKWGKVKHNGWWKNGEIHK